jgi:N-methylhydantoinase B
VSAYSHGNGSGRLDPITFELIYAQLLSAAEEMGGVLKRSSFSPIIREMNDFSCAIFARDGDLVAQADYIPAQLGAMSLVVKSTLASWRGSIEAGDVFLANHPYMGCMHTPDVNVLMPVFIRGRLFAWTGATAHHIDVGGVNPGTEGADLRQVYAEGLLLPPVHLAHRGTQNTDLISIIESNVRDPFTTRADLRAQMASCALGARRIDAAVTRYGARAITRAFSQSLEAVEQATRVALRDLPDGSAEAEGYLDDDGLGGPPTRIHAAITKRGDGLAVDLSGSAGQVPGALNVPWASTRAAVAYLIRAMTDPDMITNDGILRVVDITCPPGSILNPLPPAAVSVRHNTCQRLVDTLIRAASLLWPGRAVASSSVTFFDVNLESVSPKTARSSVMMDVVGGGTGAHRAGDGLDGVDTYMSNVALLPTEVAETEYAVRVLRTELVEQSQGAGEYNGGLGIRREYQILDFPQTATVYGEQTDARFPAKGIRGGGDGSPTRISIHGPDGRPIHLPKNVTALLQPGSVIRVETSGGGGFGEARQRAPATVRDDLLDGRAPAASDGPAGRPQTT